MKNKYAQIFSMLLIVATVYYSFYSLMPQHTKHNSFEKDFSMQKALLHLKKISEKPHYVGSKNHKEIREYIVSELDKMGLKAHIQKGTALNKGWKVATKTQNIIAKIKGTQQGKALLLLSHYDSSPHSSFGASDAGSGVVTILEGVRAFLQKNPTPKNDVIICITDAEELGLLGAKSFVQKHKWAKDVGLVLNFEARGSGGPSYMLIETNGGNSKMIEAFQKAQPSFPVASSLMYSIYKMLPNDTDLTVFREEGNVDGFNFAFIDDHFDYHTQQDSYNRMNLNTLQHQASYLTALLDYFSTSNLQLKSKDDNVYFNFPYIGLVYYPFSWVIPLFVVAVIGFLVLLFIGLSKNKLTLKGIAKGLVSFVLSIVFSGLISFYGWKLVLKIYPQYTDILQGFTYNGHYYIIAFISLTLAICFLFYKKKFKNTAPQDILIAPIFFWLLLNGGVAFYLQGASYFIFPVFIMLLFLAMFFYSEENNLGVNTLLALPVLIIFAPLVQMLPVGLGLKMLISSAVLTVFLFGFLVPIFSQYPNKKYFGRLFLLIAVLAFFAGYFKADYTKNQKKPNSILYVLDANNKKAYWASYDKNTDTFTKQFLGKNPEEGNVLGNTIASKYKSKIRKYANAPLKKIEKPIIKITSDTIVDNLRNICLHIHSVRNANRIEILTDKEIPFYTFGVNGEYVKNKNKIKYLAKKGSVITYFITEPNEDINFDFSFPKNQQINLEILEGKYDLFTNKQFTITPRSENQMPTPFVLNDATVVKTQIEIK